MKKRLWLGRHLMLKKSFVEKILSGDKTTTIRLGRIEIRSREFYIHSGGKIVAEALVEDVIYKRVRDLTDADAKADGFSSVGELKQALRRFYPELKEHDWVTIIKFRLLRRLDQEETRVYGGLPAYEVAEIALKNLEKLHLGNDELKILEAIARTKSIRAASREIFGSPFRRRFIRRTLHTVAKKLVEVGLLNRKDLQGLS
ncbi:MAG: ASCH domain-containing protein [Crenarchaeota archaeon]|nr:ASCH domain-containing protein [Thermoproteota archaeon]